MLISWFVDSAYKHCSSVDEQYCSSALILVINVLICPSLYAGWGQSLRMLFLWLGLAKAGVDLQVCNLKEPEFPLYCTIIFNLLGPLGCTSKRWTKNKKVTFKNDYSELLICTSIQVRASDFSNPHTGSWSTHKVLKPETFSWVESETNRPWCVLYVVKWKNPIAG